MYSCYTGSAIYTSGIPSIMESFGVGLVTATAGLTLFVVGYAIVSRNLSSHFSPLMCIIYRVPCSLLHFKNFPISVATPFTSSAHSYSSSSRCRSLSHPTSGRFWSSASCQGLLELQLWLRVGLPWEVSAVGNDEGAPLILSVARKICLRRRSWLLRWLCGALEQSPVLYWYVLTLTRCVRELTPSFLRVPLPFQASQRTRTAGVGPSTSSFGFPVPALFSSSSSCPKLSHLPSFSDEQSAFVVSRATHSSKLNPNLMRRPTRLP